MSKVLCILGVHRSGTSFISHWLHESGLFLGEELLKADFSNKRGHFEDQDFLNLHKQVLISQNIDPSGLFLNELPVMEEEYKRKAQVLIAERNKQGQWGWKDPRTVLFLDYYREAIPGLKTLLVLRDYRKILKSLLNRDLNRIRVNQYSGRIGRLRWILKKDLEMKGVLEKYTQMYLGSLKIYFRQIENIVNKVEPESLLPFYSSDLSKVDTLKKSLMDMGFKLENVSIEKIYNNKFRTKSEIKLSEIPHDDELDKLQSSIYTIVGKRFDHISG